MQIIRYPLHGLLQILLFLYKLYGKVISLHVKLMMPLPLPHLLTILIIGISGMILLSDLRAFLLFPMTTIALMIIFAPVIEWITRPRNGTPYI